MGRSRARLRDFSSREAARIVACDTNLGPIVRTAASELRKRPAICQGNEEHRSELRIARILCSAPHTGNRGGLSAARSERRGATAIDIDWVDDQPQGVHPWQAASRRKFGIGRGFGQGVSLGSYSAGVEGMPWQSWSCT